MTQDPSSSDPQPPVTPGTPGYGGWQQPPAGPPAPAYGYAYGPPAPPRPAASGMYVAAAVINWVVLGIVILLSCGIGIIAAAWYIPMTIFIHKGARDGYKHTALGVCTLLFCNLISGILMLVEDGNRPARPSA